MARYKVVDRSPRFLPIVLDAQLVTGSFEYALDYLIDHEIDLSELDRRYRNDDTGAPPYDPAVMLKIVLLAYSRRVVSSRSIERGWEPSDLGQALEHGHHAGPRKRCIDLEHQALTGVIVHDRKHPELPAIDQPVGHVIHRPTLVWPLRQRHLQSLGKPDALALSPAHHEALLPIQTVSSLVIHRPALPAKQHVNSSIAVAALHGRELGNTISQLKRRRQTTPVAVQRARNPHQPAGARHAQRALGGENPHRLALALRAYHFRLRRSFSAAMSSTWSATIRLSLAFSPSSSRSRRTSATVMPAYLA